MKRRKKENRRSLWEAFRARFGMGRKSRAKRGRILLEPSALPPTPAGDRIEEKASAPSGPEAGKALKTRRRELESELAEAVDRLMESPFLSQAIREDPSTGEDEPARMPTSAKQPRKWVTFDRSQKTAQRSAPAEPAQSENRLVPGQAATRAKQRLKQLLNGPQGAGEPGIVTYNPVRQQQARAKEPSQAIGLQEQLPGIRNRLDRIRSQAEEKNKEDRSSGPENGLES